MSATAPARSIFRSHAALWAVAMPLIVLLADACGRDVRGVPPAQPTSAPPAPAPPMDLGPAEGRRWVTGTTTVWTRPEAGGNARFEIVSPGWVFVAPNSEHQFRLVFRDLAHRDTLGYLSEDALHDEPIEADY